MKTRRTPTGRPRRPRRRLCLKGRHRAHVWRIEEAPEIDAAGNLLLTDGTRGNVRAECLYCHKTRRFHPSRRPATWETAAQRAA